MPALVVGGLVLALVGGFGVGKALSPSGSVASGAAPAASIPPHAHGDTAGVGNDVTGLSISAGGYTLVPSTTTFQAGTPGTLTFQVTGPDRKALTRFAIEQERRLHLIVARHDLTGFQHLHPEMGADGTWSVPLTLPAAGLWRAYADFVAVGADGQRAGHTLAVDLTVPGDYRPGPFPVPAREARSGDYTVTMEGTTQVGATQPLSLRVFSAGAPVTALERYLGSYGHLVVLREGDLGYLHVHPEAQLVGGAVKFWLAAPSPGRYRAFFEFQVGGEVRLAEFTLAV
jgi:hypothetical protein